MSEEEKGGLKRSIENTEEPSSKKLKSSDSGPLGPIKLKKLFDSGEYDEEKNPEGGISVGDFEEDDYSNLKRTIHPKTQKNSTKWQFGTVETPIYAPFGLQRNERKNKDGTVKQYDTPGELTGIINIRFFGQKHEYFNQEAWEVKGALESMDKFKDDLIKQDISKKIDDIKKAVEGFKNIHKRNPNNQEIVNIIGPNYFVAETSLSVLEDRYNDLSSITRGLIKTPTQSPDSKIKKDDYKPIPYTKITMRLKHAKFTTCNIYFVDENIEGESIVKEISDEEKELLFGQPFYYYIQGGCGSLNPTKGWGLTNKGYNLYITEFGSKEKLDRDGKKITVVKDESFSISNMLRKKQNNLGNNSMNAKDIIN